MTTIKKLLYNYVPPMMETRNGGEIIDLYCEEYKTATIGEDGVIEIEEHRAAGEGDKWYYDIIYQDRTIRTFAPYMVEFINL